MTVPIRVPARVVRYLNDATRQQLVTPADTSMIETVMNTAPLIDGSRHVHLARAELHCLAFYADLMAMAAHATSGTDPRDLNAARAVFDATWKALAEEPR